MKIYSIYIWAEHEMEPALQVIEDEPLVEFVLFERWSPDGVCYSRPVYGRMWFKAASTIQADGIKKALGKDDSEEEEDE